MSEAHELKKIASSSSLIGIGRMVSLLCQFVTGVLVVRIITPAEFGLLSLALTLTGILVIFTNFGMGLGLPRIIAKQNVTPSAKKILGQTIVSAILFSLLLSSMCTLSLYTGAEKLTIFFNKDGLAYVLKILSLLITPLALITIFGGVFQGFETTKPSVIFSSICLNFSKILFVLAVVITGLKFKGVIAANLASAWITFFLFAIYLKKKLHKRFDFSFSLTNTSDILQFSFPLLGVQLLGQLIIWITTLLLGYFQPSEIVGLYSAPLRLVILLAMPLQAVAFLYLPIATRSIAGKEDFDIAELYVTVTKWIAILTLPMALAMILDSKFIVTTLFGQKYLESANVLALLAVAYSFHALLGPNGMTLIAFGKRQPLLFATAIGGISSTLACVFLIPDWGATGAAFGVCIGMILSNTYISITLNKYFKIHAFKTNFVKPAFWIIIISIILLQTVQSIGYESVLLHIVIYLALMISALLAPFITRSISPAEHELFLELQTNKKIPSLMKKFIKYFAK